MACALMGADITFAHLSANDMGAVSVGHSEQSQTGTLQSTVQATHITAHAGRDASVQASQLRADQNITLSAQRNTYLVAAAQLDQNTSHTNSNINSTVLAMEDKTRADTRTTEGVRIFV